MSDDRTDDSLRPETPPPAPPPVPPPPPPATLPPPATGGYPHEERMWAMGCHLSGLIGYLIPFGNVIAPLVVWVMLREKWRLVDDQGKEALNFQISMTIWMLLAGVLCFFCIGIPILFTLIVVDFVLILIAAIKASEGTAYRYPLTVRLLQ